MTKAALVLVAGLLAVVVGTGCAGSRSDRDSTLPPGPGSQQATTEPLEPLSGVDVVVSSAEYAREAAVYQLAENRSMLLCMRSQGFEVNVLPPLPQPETFEAKIDQRRQRGWGLSDPPRPPSVIVTDANREDYDRAAFGAPSEVVVVNQGELTATARVGGCRGSAIASVYGGIDTWNDLTNGPTRHYNAAIAFESPTDRANADASWVACMRARGYSYTQEGQPRQDLKAQYAADPTTAGLRERELRTAVDDGECINQSGLVDVKRKGAEAYLAQSATASEEVNRILAEHRRVHASAGAQLAATNEELGVR